MPGMLRRRLFWQVYLTLIASLVLVAVLGAIVGHALMAAGMQGGRGFSLRSIPASVHILVFLLLVGAAVGIVAYPMVVRITRRLEALRASVEAWDGSGGSRRAIVDGGDEIAAVARSFNFAAERAEALLAAHKALLANASHELRSPLARLRMAAELFADGAKAEHLAAINRDIAELDGLVGEILLASRLDHPSSAFDRAETERVDVLALVAEEAARAGVAVAPVDPARGPFEVTGSSRLLRRMARNLIENAIKHGAPPVEVEVAVQGTAKPMLAISVRDHGPGVAPEFRERVFEPFFRPMGWSEEAGSWGLGLSLARQIARRHGGEVTCEADPNGTTAFRVELPMALQADQSSAI